MVVYDTRYPLLPNSRPLLLSSQRSQDRKSQLLFPGGGLRRKWLPPYLKLPASIIWCSNRAGPGHENHQMAQAGTRRKAKARSHGKSRKRWPTPESSRRRTKIQGKIRDREGWAGPWTTGPSRGTDSDIPEITTIRFIGRDQVAEGVCRSRQIDGTKSSPSE